MSSLIIDLKDFFMNGAANTSGADHISISMNKSIILQI